MQIVNLICVQLLYVCTHRARRGSTQTSPSALLRPSRIQDHLCNFTHKRQPSRPCIRIRDTGLARTKPISALLREVRRQKLCLEVKITQESAHETVQSVAPFWIYCAAYPEGIDRKIDRDEYGLLAAANGCR